MKVEQLTPPLVVHGEGPAWSPRWSGIRWLDMLEGDVLELMPSGSVRRRHVGPVASLIAPRRGGGTMLATGTEVLVSDSDDLDAALDPIASLVDSPACRLNEGGCAPDGSLYIGSMAFDGASGRGSLWRIGADHTPVTAIDPVTVSNGIAWSPDGSTAYYADTPTDRVDMFSWTPDDGLSDRRPFASVGGPDGLCVDAEGGVWVARYGAGAVHRYAPDGALTAIIRVPAPFTTSVAFVGPDLRQLVVTTSRLEPQAGELGGALFAVDPGVAGVALTEFAG
ncbi:SMP-30/gluconolactonase/LRE family protein [Sinomonas terrae]|uniref:SMP-30/gluconolactonase/LRE family protein n=1 Tax=Sinomonas terrae TaxID=2908838 RepID=A0ABS9U5Z5_9MICC|nr:SMP-30/gluconolactonase/LRE family protein [Sinomonas terrae]MCH6472109.1 SMP-30/gluconolactonase/LRE family protein [Sinomonas terrae]